MSRRVCVEVLRLALLGAWGILCVWNISEGSRGKRIGGGRGGRPVLRLDRQPDLLAVDRYSLGRFDPETNGAAADLHHRHQDLAADHDALSGTSREDQHQSRL